MITRDTELQSGQVTHHNHIAALLHSGILLVRDKKQKQAARALSTVYCTYVSIYKHTATTALIDYNKTRVYHMYGVYPILFFVEAYLRQVRRQTWNNI